MLKWELYLIGKLDGEKEIPPTSDINVFETKDLIRVFGNSQNC